MARTPEAVASFLDDLRERAALKAVTDLAELANASEKAAGARQIMPWDLRYAISRLKQARYAVDELEIATYLPLDACLEGLFATTGTLLGICFEEVPTLDLTYHSAGYDGDTTGTLAETAAQHGLHHIEGTHLQSGFLHLFGYDAAYYGYLWSQVIGDDMYTRFEAAGPLDTGTGAAYRRAVLGRGGTVDGEVMVRDFLGRDPDNAAFLRRIGLSAS
jgi:Zn-dependent oligopeptidase